MLKSPRLKDMAATMRKMKVEASQQKRVFDVPEAVKRLANEKGLIWDDDVEYDKSTLSNRDSQMWVLQTMTPIIVSQGAFSLWLAAETASNDVRLDYLLSGRNVALPDPQPFESFAKDDPINQYRWLVMAQV
ncbi:hypothetical protein F66182_4531 [Fusarium sp. NRRL 66182]|nr:hypothetical protein F66182_4531 [Fusarium sp. NRRL 66182]